jgi:hypothetical protein
MFSGVYGKIDHILNGTDHRALKKAHGIGIGAAWDWGIVANHGRTVLNSLSALSILTTIAKLFQTSEVAV